MFFSLPSRCSSAGTNFVFLLSLPAYLFSCLGPIFLLSRFRPTVCSDLYFVLIFFCAIYSDLFGFALLRMNSGVR